MWNLPPIVAHIVELVLLIAFSGIALGAGLRLLNILALSPLLSLGERLVFGLALGYGTLSFSMLGLGLLGLLYLPAGLIVLALLTAAGYRPLIREASILLPAFRGILGSLRYPPNAALALVILAVVGVALCKALVPVATQDDLMYHLALPRRYIEAHSIGFYPDSTYSLFPQLMEMLNTWGLLLGSDRLAVLFALSVSLIGPVAAGLFAKRFLAEGRGGVWQALPLLAVAIYLSTPLVGYVQRAANTDLAQASFDFLAVYAFTFWILNFGVWKSSTLPTQNPNDPRLLVLAGICCGLSFSVKYYGFAMAVALGLALAAILLYRQFRLRTRPKPQSGRVQVAVQETKPLTIAGRFRAAQAAPFFLLLYFALPFLDVVIPWILRNVVASGNPIWPLAGRLLGGVYWSPEASPETLLGVAPSFSPANIWTGLEFMWNAYSRGPLVIDNQQHVVNLGTLLLPALLTLPFARWTLPARFLAYAAGAYWLIWAFFFSRTSARYLSTFFLLAALLGAYGIVSMAARYRQLRWAVGGIVGIALGFLVVQSVLSVGTYLPTALAFDRATESKYLQAYMGDYPMVQYIEKNTPQNAGIYLWDGQPRGYYVPRSYVYARLVPLYTGFGSEPDKWRARMGELGITHVLVHERDMLAPGQPIGQDPARAIGQEFANRYFGQALFTVGDYALYPLR